jgi:hypothetical protein
MTDGAIWRRRDNLKIKCTFLLLSSVDHTRPESSMVRHGVMSGNWRSSTLLIQPVPD